MKLETLMESDESGTMYVIRVTAGPNMAGKKVRYYDHNRQTSPSLAMAKFFPTKEAADKNADPKDWYSEGGKNPPTLEVVPVNYQMPGVKK